MLTIKEKTIQYGKFLLLFFFGIALLLFDRILHDDGYSEISFIGFLAMSISIIFTILNLQLERIKPEIWVVKNIGLLCLLTGILCLLFIVVYAYFTNSLLSDIILFSMVLIFSGLLFTIINPNFLSDEQIEILLKEGHGNTLLNAIFKQASFTRKIIWVVSVIIAFIIAGYTHQYLQDLIGQWIL